jgi:hypothetical protein
LRMDPLATPHSQQPVIELTHPQSGRSPGCSGSLSAYARSITLRTACSPLPSGTFTLPIGRLHKGKRKRRLAKEHAPIYGYTPEPIWLSMGGVLFRLSIVHSDLGRSSAGGDWFNWAPRRLVWLHSVHVLGSGILYHPFGSHSRAVFPSSMEDRRPAYRNRIWTHCRRSIWLGCRRARGLSDDRYLCYLHRVVVLVARPSGDLF